MDNNYLDALVPGVFVAVNLSNCGTFPVIGKVVKVLDNDIELNYWKGPYSKSWEPHMVKDGRQNVPRKDVLPKQSIILCDFKLDDVGKIPENARKYLKRWYRDNN